MANRPDCRVGVIQHGDSADLFIMGDVNDEKVKAIQELKVRLDQSIENIMRQLYAAKATSKHPPERIWFAEIALEIYKHQSDFCHYVIATYGCSDHTVLMTRAMNEQLELIQQFCIPLLCNTIPENPNEKSQDSDIPPT